MPSTPQTIIVNTCYLYLRLGISMFITLWTTRLILNSLGVSDFGLFNTIGGAIGLMGFLNASMAGSTQRYMSYYQGAGDNKKCVEIFNISIVIHTILSLIIVIALVIAGLFFFDGLLNIPNERKSAAVVVYGALVLSTAFTVMTVPYDAIVNSHENMRYYAIVGIILSILKLMVAFVVVYSLTDKLIVYGILMALVSMIGLVIMRAYCHKKYKECLFSPMLYWNKNTAKDITQFAGWNFIRSFSSFIGNYGSLLILNHFFGVLLNAAAGIASQLGGQLQTFSNSMQKALDPAITKREGMGERYKMMELTISGCKFSFATFAFFALPAIIEMPFLLKIWLNKTPEYSALFSRLILIWTLIYIIARPLEQSIMSEGHISGYSRLFSILNLFPIILLVFLYSHDYPPVTMYYVDILFLAVFVSAARVYYAHKKLGLSYRIFFLRVIIPILLSFSLAFGITSLPCVLLEEGIYRLFITLFLGIFSYSVSFWYLSTNEKEKIAINSLFKNIESIHRKQSR